MNYFGARYLDPMLGLWISVDPARQFSSPYLYVGNGVNPVNGVDDDGNEFDYSDPDLMWAYADALDYAIENHDMEVYDRLFQLDMDPAVITMKKEAVPVSYGSAAYDPSEHMFHYNVNSLMPLDAAFFHEVLGHAYQYLNESRSYPMPISNEVDAYNMQFKFFSNPLDKAYRLRSFYKDDAYFGASLMRGMPYLYSEKVTTTTGQQKYYNDYVK